MAVLQGFEPRQSEPEPAPFELENPWQIIYRTSMDFQADEKKKTLRAGRPRPARPAPDGGPFCRLSILRRGGAILLSRGTPSDQVRRNSGAGRVRAVSGRGASGSPIRRRRRRGARSARSTAPAPANGRGASRSVPLRGGRSGLFQRASSPPAR